MKMVLKVCEKLVILGWNVCRNFVSMEQPQTACPPFWSRSNGNSHKLCATPLWSRSVWNYHKRRVLLSGHGQPRTATSFVSVTPPWPRSVENSHKLWATHFWCRHQTQQKLAAHLPLTVDQTENATWPTSRRQSVRQKKKKSSFSRLWVRRKLLSVSLYRSEKKRGKNVHLSL